MTPFREAFLLPAIFLTVTLAGGLRVGPSVQLVPPPLSAIVIAVLLVSALVRAGVFVPAVFLAAERRPIENLSGTVVLLTLLAASAQAVHLVLPERGLLHFAFAAFLFVQVLSLSAGGSDRRGMLRSLFVLLGAAFVLRFIILESLYAPDGGAVKRVLTALMAGVTLGGIEYQPHAAITGYAAFTSLALYLSGLVLLPAAVSPPPSASSAMTRRVHEGLTIPLLVGTLVLPSACGGAMEPEPKNPATVGEAKASTGADETPGSIEHERALRMREDALARARVWMEPAVPPSAANLGSNPDSALGLGETNDVPCRFSLEAVGGLTSKFNCELPDGTIVKVKYGAANPELHAEVAATRLISALGFAADRMYVIRSVQCAGCPLFPFQALRCMAKTGMRRVCFPTGINYERVTVFDPAVVERRLEGRKIEAIPDQGWAWYELNQIDAAKGGSSRAEVDALKLLAVFLAHWDNKAENQRLICPPGSDLPGGGCSRPVAMMQDMGGTFGPLKLDLHNWRRTPVWADAPACRVSMAHMPFEGATFPEQQISEGGRQFLLRLLEQLSSDQIETLFTSSRATTFDAASLQGRSAAAWARAFLDKVRQIRDAGPCPS
jgi:hypothetical protein